MFTGEEHTRIRSTKPPEELRERIKDALGIVGRVTISRDGDIDIRADRHSGVAWEVKIDGSIEQRREPDEYTIVISYRIEPSVAGLVLGIIFFMPVGLIFLLLAVNAKQTLQRRISDALRDIEDELDERK